MIPSRDPALTDRRERTDGHVAHVAQRDADDPRRRPGGARGLAALAADLLDHVAAVDGRDA